MDQLLHKYYLLFLPALDSMAIGGASGILTAAILDASILIPIITTLLIPFLKDFGEKVIIPYFRKKFKIKDQNDKDNEKT